MSHLRFCLFTFLVLGIVAGFASQDVSDDICNHKIEPGSENVKLGLLENLMKTTKIKLESLGKDLKARTECLNKFVEDGLKIKKEILENIIKIKMEILQEMMELAIDKKGALEDIFKGIMKQKMECMENILRMKKKALGKMLEKSLDAKNILQNVLENLMKDTRENMENMLGIKKKELEQLMEGVDEDNQDEIQKVLNKFMEEQMEDLEKMFETKEESLEDALKNKKYLDNILKSLKKNANDTKEHIKDRWNKLFRKKSEEPNQVSCNSKIMNEFKEPFQLIFPGTKWCGDGDKATNDDDLGKLKELDKCCRAHDKCEKFTEAGEVLGNLKNDGLFTKSACSCDSEFYNCLKGVNNLIANSIGIVYFDILRPQCFQCKCPKEDCDKEIDQNCLNSCERYEWVDNSIYW